jgi:hypothetical protein
MNVNMNQKTELEQNESFFDELGIRVEGMGGYVVLKVARLQELCVDGSEEAAWWLTPEEARRLAEALLRTAQAAGA